MEPAYSHGCSVNRWRLFQHLYSQVMISHLSTPMSCSCCCQNLQWRTDRQRVCFLLNSATASDPQREIRSRCFRRTRVEDLKSWCLMHNGKAELAPHHCPTLPTSYFMSAGATASPTSDFIPTKDASDEICQATTTQSNTDKPLLV